MDPTRLPTARIAPDSRTAFKVEPLPGLAAELVRLKVDVFVTWGTPATRAAREATQTIPIVMAAATDPVGTGLVASLSRPGRCASSSKSCRHEISANSVPPSLG